jgi:SAM-dependent methyltransferase
VSTVRDIADESIDVVVSFHALEHVDDPQLVIRHMWRILRPGGAMRLVVPCDIPVLTKGHRSWELDDMNMHLYSWSPLTLGNLVSVCGFKVDDARLVPDSAGGRLGRMLPESSMLRQWLSWFKALRGGRFHTIVTARKTPVVDTGR